MENEQAKKNFLIRVGVISSATLIFIFWFLNSKNVFVFNSPEAEVQNQSLDGLVQEFSEAMDKMEDDFEEVKENDSVKKLSDEEFLRNLIAETDKLATSSSTENLLAEPDDNNAIIEESSATSSPEESANTNIPEKSLNNSACPAYVNCMPTIGASRQCQIPAGCEGVTQLVY